MQPSQIYINQDKLKSIKQKIANEGVNSLNPIPVKKLGEELIMTDGHTRAFSLYKRGNEKMKCKWEDEELNWEIYKVCVNWAKEREIFSVKDLEGRVISNKDYQRLWIERCHNLKAEINEFSNSS